MAPTIAFVTKKGSFTISSHIFDHQSKFIYSTKYLYL